MLIKGVPISGRACKISLRGTGYVSGPGMAKGHSFHAQRGPVYVERGPIDMHEIGYITVHGCVINGQMCTSNLFHPLLEHYFIIASKKRPIL